MSPEPFNRRRALQTLGASAALSLAGCAGGKSSGGSTPEEGGSGTSYGIRAQNLTRQETTVQARVLYPLGGTPTDQTETREIFEKTVSLAPDARHTWRDVLPGSGEFVVVISLPEATYPFPEANSMGSDSIRVDTEDGEPEPGMLQAQVLRGTEHPESNSWNLEDVEPLYGVVLLPPGAKRTDTG